MTAKFQTGRYLEMEADARAAAAKSTNQVEKAKQLFLADHYAERARVAGLIPSDT